MQTICAEPGRAKQACTPWGGSEDTPAPSLEAA